MDIKAIGSGAGLLPAASSMRQQLESGSDSTSVSNLYYDVRDTNKDGIVSLQEELDYTLTHPGSEVAKQVESQAAAPKDSTLYNRQGSTAADADRAQKLIDIFI